MAFREQHAGSTEFRPFSNGTERIIWEHRNCHRCWKHTPPEHGTNFRCAIESALLRHYAFDQPIRRSILNRLGISATHPPIHLPDCPEREEKRPRPNQNHEARAIPGQESFL